MKKILKTTKIMELKYQMTDLNNLNVKEYHPI